MTREDQNASEGFSLVEMLVLLTIISMTAYVAFPYFLNRQPSLVNDTAPAMLHMAQKARLTAISTHRRTAITVDLDNRRISGVDPAGAITLRPGTRLTVLTGKELVTADRNASIEFLPDGSSTGGRIEIGTEREEVDIDINWLTGIAHLRTNRS